MYYQSRGVAVPLKMCDGRTLQDGVREVFRALACLCAQLGLECRQVGGRMGWNNCYLQAAGQLGMLCNTRIGLQLQHLRHLHAGP